MFNQINSVNSKFARAGSFNTDIGMFTGFTPIDVIASNMESVPDHDVTILNGGLFNNPYNEIGMSAVGKTTLWIQAISSAMTNWYRYYGPVTECIFYNVENHTTPRRWMDISGYDERMMNERVRFISKSLSIIEIYNDIAAFANEKSKHIKDLTIDTGILSVSGETVKILPTTYVLIDSIAAVRIKSEVELDKDGNIKDDDTIAGATNMDAMRSAKDNTMFINEVKKLCESVKICIIMTNHLVEVPVLDRYNPPKPVLPSLKFTQRLKGGNELIFQSFGVNLLTVLERLFNEKSKIYGDSVHGLIAMMEWAKNKNGPEGVKYPMVFDSATGYKPELGDFEILYRSGSCYGISGSPASYYMDILPEVKFTRKTLLSRCYENPLLARAIGFTTRLYLVSEIILRENPPDIRGIGEVDYESRIDMILKHSIDYPGYFERGLLVDKELIESTKTYDMMLNRYDSFNLSIDKQDIEFMKCGGDVIISDNSFSVMGNEIKLEGTEYIVADSNDWNSK